MLKVKFPDTDLFRILGLRLTGVCHPLSNIHDYIYGPPRLKIRSIKPCVGTRQQSLSTPPRDLGPIYSVGDVFILYYDGNGPIVVNSEKTRPPQHPKNHALNRPSLYCHRQTKSNERHPSIQTIGTSFCLRPRL